MNPDPSTGPAVISTSSTSTPEPNSSPSARLSYTGGHVIFSRTSTSLTGPSPTAGSAESVIEPGFSPSMSPVSSPSASPSSGENSPRASSRDTRNAVAGPSSFQLTSMHGPSVGSVYRPNTPTAQQSTVRSAQTAHAQAASRLASRNASARPRLGVNGRQRPASATLSNTAPSLRQQLASATTDPYSVQAFAAARSRARTRPASASFSARVQRANVAAAESRRRRALTTSASSSSLRPASRQQSTSRPLNTAWASGSISSTSQQGQSSLASLAGDSPPRSLREQDDDGLAALFSRGATRSEEHRRHRNRIEAIQARLRRVQQDNRRIMQQTIPYSSIVPQRQRNTAFTANDPPPQVGLDKRQLSSLPEYSCTANRMTEPCSICLDNISL